MAPPMQGDEIEAKAVARDIALMSSHDMRIETIAKALTAAEARGYARCKEEAARVADMVEQEYAALTHECFAVGEAAGLKIAAAIRALKP